MQLETRLEQKLNEFKAQIKERAEKRKRENVIKIEDQNGFEKTVKESDVDEFLIKVTENICMDRYKTPNLHDMGMDEVMIYQALRSGYLYKNGYTANRCGRNELVVNIFRTTTCVYFVACIEAGKIKIGKTQNLNTRFMSLCTMSPVPLKLVHAVIYRNDLEEKIHKHLSEYRSHGEWFNADKPVLDLISQLTKQGLKSLVNEVYKPLFSQMDGE